MNVTIICHINPTGRALQMSNYWFLLRALKRKATIVKTLLEIKKAIMVSAKILTTFNAVGRYKVYKTKPTHKITKVYVHNIIISSSYNKQI